MPCEGQQHRGKLWETSQGATTGGKLWETLNDIVGGNSCVRCTKGNCERCCGGKGTGGIVGCTKVYISEGNGNVRHCVGQRLRRKLRKMLHISMTDVKEWDGKVVGDILRARGVVCCAWNFCVISFWDAPSIKFCKYYVLMTTYRKHLDFCCWKCVNDNMLRVYLRYTRNMTYIYKKMTILIKQGTNWFF